MKFGRVAAVCITTVCATVLMPAAAQAFSESGSRTCSSNEHVVVRSTGKGTVRHYAPSGTLVGTFSNASYMERLTHTSLSATNWVVDATLGLQEPTGSYCAPGA